MPISHRFKAQVLIQAKPGGKNEWIANLLYQ